MARQYLSPCTAKKSSTSEVSLSPSVPRTRRPCLLKSQWKHNTGGAEEEQRINSTKDRRLASRKISDQNSLRMPSQGRKVPRKCDKKNQRCRSRRDCSRPHEGTAVAEWEPEPSSQGLPSCLLWVAPASFVTGSRSQPLLDAPTPRL